jgi:hypothetical protein
MFIGSAWNASRKREKTTLLLLIILLLLLSYQLTHLIQDIGKGERIKDGG